MKVLSLLQPWATLVILGAKKYEVRSWQTKYRGLSLIHASSQKANNREKLFFEHADYFNKFIINAGLLPYGSLIGKVEVRDIYKTEWLLQHFETDPLNNWQQELAFDDFTPNRFAWKLINPIALKYMLPLIGSLGL